MKKRMGGKRFCRSLDATSPTKVKSMTGGPDQEGTNMIEEINPHLSEDFSTMVRKVMVVVDSTREAKRALLWVLSHTLLKHDRLILLHVALLPPGSAKKGNESPFPASKRYLNPKDSNVLNSLKALCVQRRPEVEVEVLIVGGFMDKGPTILHQAKKRSVSLLVLGQPQPPLLWKLRAILSEGSWRGKSQDSSAAAAVVEYCIQNSECITVAVRMKSRRMGGYLISTKRQKNFWLLA